MKDVYISDIKVNQEIISYFIVKMVAVKVGSNKKGLPGSAAGGLHR